MTGLRLGGVVERVVAAARDRLAEPPARSPRTQRRLLLAAAVLFVVAAVVAWRHLPALEQPVRWWLLATVAALGVPATVVVNAVEFQLSARIAGHRVGLGRSVAVMTVARAANVLPLPGSTLVRIGALKQQGATYGRALSATLTVAVAWLGAAFLTAGALLVVATGSRVAWLGLALGGLAFVLTFGLVRFHVGAVAAPRLTARVLLVDLSLVAVSALRLGLVLFALGFPITMAQAAALTVAEVLASATGVFPGGLGIREVVAGAIAPVVGLPVALGVVAAAADRVVDYAVLAPACLGIWLVVTRRQTARAAPDADLTGGPSGAGTLLSADGQSAQGR